MIGNIESSVFCLTCLLVKDENTHFCAPVQYKTNVSRAQSGCSTSLASVVTWQLSRGTGKHLMKKWLENLLLEGRTHDLGTTTKISSFRDLCLKDEISCFKKHSACVNELKGKKKVFHLMHLVRHLKIWYLLFSIISLLSKLITAASSFPGRAINITLETSTRLVGYFHGTPFWTSATVFECP